MHIDEGNPRPMRAMNLADALVKAGHKVVLWSSAFYHQEKRHRSHRCERIMLSPSLEIRLIPSSGYQHNIGLGRLRDHLALAHNLKRMLIKESSLPDVAFVGYPPIESAVVMTNWLSSRGVPSLLDVKDQWPSIFLEAMPVSLRKFGKLGFWPYFYYSKKALRQASGLSSMADSFLQWGLDFAGREKGPYDSVFPLTSPPWQSEDRNLEKARLWLDNQGINDGRQDFRLVFIGSHTAVFDFEPVREAALTLWQISDKIQFVICGDGELSAQLRSMMQNIPNVIFPGWIDSSQIKALAERSHVAVTPYKNNDSFTKSIPNKVIDALSLGLPIISPLHGEVADLISSYNVGIRYGTDSGKSLVQCIQMLMDNAALRKQISKNAQKLYQEKFSYEIVYGALVRHLEKLSLKRMQGT